MASIGLLTTTLLAVVAASLFSSVAGTVMRRHAARALLGHVAYATGWAGLALVLWSDAGRFALGLVPDPSTPFYLALVTVKILATAAALGGFATYIVYAWTGAAWTAWITAGVGVVHGFFWLTVTNASLPGVVVVGTWGTRMEYGTASSPLPGGPALGAAMFFLPLLVVAITYVAFWAKVERRGQRFRLAIVAVSLILFLVAAAVQGNPNVSPDNPALAVNMLVMVLGGLMARLAFVPPRSWQDHFGVEPYGG